MKTKIITLVMILCALCAFSTFALQIDPGTGTRISDSTLLSPVWSPDGKWIASLGFDGKWWLQLTPSEGGATEKLYTPTPSEGYILGLTKKPCFTPDSQEVVFTYSLIDKNRGTIVNMVNGSGSIINQIPIIMAVNIKSKATRVIREEAENARYSHNGRYFAYVNYDHRAVTDPAHAEHHYSLAVYDTVTKETKYLTDNLGVRTGDFSFSSDDTYLAVYISESNGPPKIYRINLDGSNTEEISSSDNPWKLPFFSTPECSPGGGWIMYTASESTNTTRALLVYDTATKKTTPVFPISTVQNTAGTWSPDGKKFCCSLVLKSTNKGALYTYDFIEKNLGKEPVLQEVAQYIPQGFGTKLININLNAISPSDSSLYQGTKILETNQQFAVWSPDGKWIAVSTPVANMIWIVPAGGGAPINVADFTHNTVYKGYELASFGSPTVTAFTPDSQEIVYNTTIIDESRGTTVTITDEITSTGTRHFGVSVMQPINVIKAVNIYTGAIRLVMDAASWGTFSHNGKYFAYTSSITPKDPVTINILDMETKKSRIFYNGGGQPVCFNKDDSYLVAIAGPGGGYTMLPLGQGGEKKVPQYTTSMSPDDRFVIYGALAGAGVVIRLYDMVLGKTINVLPEGTEFQSWNGSFSPDGKKFCYQLISKVEPSWTRLYVRDFNPAEFSSITSVDIAKPLEFALQGNYPNPFNPSTSIQFSLAKAGKVNLTIYSVAGQKIRELFTNTEMTPGIHHVLWDGRDDLGKPVSSGVYITRLHMGGKALAGRMLLMK
ncbi:MAG: T9SS type A sorting domain-containing protein [Candidatus Latescibacter sp.]|nr:T9SS type A sorting domain-containing protein [Candidatus Latescibacter sp.]